VLLTASEIDKKAETIHILDRNIKTLEFLTDCDQLKELEIDGCTIQEGVCLPEIATLEKLSVNYCGQGAIDIIKNNPQIRILSLCYDGIEDIGSLENFHSLTELSLHGNNITDLSTLSVMSELETLGLLDGNTEITTLRPLYGLDKLMSINVNWKVYQSLPKEEMAHFGNDPDDENAGIIKWD
jgi:internalin A